MRVWCGGATPARRMALTPARRPRSPPTCPRGCCARARELLLTRGSDTIHVAVPPVGTALANDGRCSARTARAPTPPTGADRTADPGGTYKWFFLPGTVRSRSRGRNGDYARVRLDSQLEIWVDHAELHALPPAWLPTAARRGRTCASCRSPSGSISSCPCRGGRRTSWKKRPHELMLTLYGTTINTDLVNYALGRFARARCASGRRDGRARRITLHLSRPPYGYLVFCANARARAAPAAAARASIRARRSRGSRSPSIPGHPPIGATGHTGCSEPGRRCRWHRLQQMLEQRGAQGRDDAHDAGSRRARRSSDHRAQGERERARVDSSQRAAATGSIPSSPTAPARTSFARTVDPLARALQRGMVAQMGLPRPRHQLRQSATRAAHLDPAVLCEGAFLMMPEQENALRTPEFQERYARGDRGRARGYFRSLPGNDGRRARPRRARDCALSRRRRDARAGRRRTAHWRTLDTPHFHVHFARALEAAARRRGGERGAAYAELATQLVRRAGTIDLVVSDDADFSNGSTTPFPDESHRRVRHPPLETGAPLLRMTGCSSSSRTSSRTSSISIARAASVARRADIFGRAPRLFPNLYQPGVGHRRARGLLRESTSRASAA